MGIDAVEIQGKTLRCQKGIQNKGFSVNVADLAEIIDRPNSYLSQSGMEYITAFLAWQVCETDHPTIAEALSKHFGPFTGTQGVIDYTDFKA